MIQIKYSCMKFSADGQATTILLPAELQGIASLAATWKESVKKA